MIHKQQKVLDESMSILRGDIKKMDSPINHSQNLDFKITLANQSNKIKKLLSFFEKGNTS